MSDLESVGSQLYTQVAERLYKAASVPEFEGDASDAMRQNVAAALVKVDVLAECVSQLGRASKEVESVMKYYVEGPGNVKKVPSLDELGYWAGSEGRYVVRGVEIVSGSVTTVQVEDTKKGDVATKGFSGIAGSVVPDEVFSPIFEDHVRYADSATHALRDVVSWVETLPSRDAVARGDDVSVVMSRTVFSPGVLSFGDSGFAGDPVARDLVKSASFGSEFTSLSQALDEQQIRHAESVKAAQEKVALAEAKEEKAAKPAAAAVAPAPRVSFPSSGGGGFGAPTAPRMGGFGAGGGVPDIPGLTRISGLPGMETGTGAEDVIDIEALFDKFAAENKSSHADEVVSEPDEGFDYSTLPDGYVFAGYEDDGTVVFKEIPEGAVPIYNEDGHPIGYWPPGAEPPGAEPDGARPDAAVDTAEEEVELAGSSASAEVDDEVDEEGIAQARQRVEEALT